MAGPEDETGKVEGPSWGDMDRPITTEGSKEKVGESECQSTGQGKRVTHEEKKKARGYPRGSPHSPEGGGGIRVGKEGVIQTGNCWDGR